MNIRKIRALGVAAFLAVAGVVTMSVSAFAQRQDRLAGFGQASMTISSGRETTESRIAFAFRVIVENRGTVSGFFSAAPAEDRGVPVTIEGQQYVLETIRGTNITEVEVDFTAPSSYVFRGFGAVDVTDASGRPLSFQAALVVSGEVGDGGQPFNFAVAIGPGGSQGSIGGTGTTDSGASVTAVTSASGPTDRNNLLKGLYSGEFHGETTDGFPVVGVMTIGFDGNGGITGGRIHRAIGPAHSPSPFAIHHGVYAIESDGMGPLSLSGQGWFMNLAITVGDGGRIVKLLVYSDSGTALIAVGDLVKQ